MKDALCKIALWVVWGLYAFILYLTMASTETTRNISSVALAVLDIITTTLMFGTLTILILYSFKK